MLNLLFPLIFFFILSCSPKYKIVKEYIPSNEHYCIDSCKEKLLSCKKECFKNYNRCLEQSLHRAKKLHDKLSDEYRTLLAEYEKRYRQYLDELKLYNLKLQSKKEDLKFYEKICKQYKDKEACFKTRQLKKEIKKYVYRKPTPPRKPVYISFKELLKEERKQCSCDCGCEKLYDTCFESCGGRILIKKICIENCD